MDFETEFKNFRKRLEDNDTKLSESVFTDRLPKLLEVLGQLSPYLRDELGWSTLATYFRSSLCPSLLRFKLLEILYSDDFLFFEIAKGESPASVKRTFSALALADLLVGDVKNELIFDEKQLNKLAEKLCLYLSMEQDFRGQDQNLGWVHAIAHAGDCFAALISHPHFSEQSILKCLLAIMDYIEKRAGNIFSGNEERRLGCPIAIAISRLSYETINSTVFQRYSQLYEMPSCQNISNTLRCVYLELLWNCENKDKENIMAGIEQIIR